MPSQNLAKHAESLAEGLLEPLGQRWRHVRAVAERARSICSPLQLPEEVLVSAAYLHDLGYAPELATTGFHPLDGARAVRSEGFPETVASLVAYHSMAPIEAELRGLIDALTGEFDAPDGALADALCYCDMVTGPAGQQMQVEDRLDEIQVRYGPGNVVTTFIGRARPEIIASVRRVESRLVAAQDSVNGTLA